MICLMLLIVFAPVTCCWLYDTNPTVNAKVREIGQKIYEVIE